MNVCSKEGAPVYENYCYSTTELAKINARSPMSGQPTAQNSVHNALCIEKKNIASRVRL